MKLIFRFFSFIKNKFLSFPLIIRIIILVIIVGGSGYLIYSKITNKDKTTYKTTTVTKGTLVTSISSTGTITSSNKTSITTGATGTIKTVYIENGETVAKGQKIAEIILDDDGITNQTTAWANYLTMQQNYKEAVADRTAADIQMWNDRQSVIDAQEEYDNMIAGGWNPSTHAEYTYNEKAVVTKRLDLAKETFTADETKYNNYSAFVTKSQQQMSQSYENYKKVSSTIYAPATGTISNLSIAPGVIISNSSDSITVSTGTNSSENSSSVTSHSVGSITNPQGQYQATLSLTESEIVKIKSGQKVIMTMDAFSDTTFTGEVLSVDVAGSSSSGVTSYSVVVLLDDTDKEIYTNMSVTATIIVDSQSDVLLIPSTAIDTTSDGTTTVRTYNNGEISTVTVITGSTNDNQTVITSGLNEGDTIISSSVTNDANSNNNTSPSFSSSNSNNSSRTNSGFGGMGGGMPPGM